MNRFCRLIFAAVAGVIFASQVFGAIPQRIQEKSAVFASLDPRIQQDLSQGIIHRGDTPDMVWIALGQPFTVTQLEKDPAGELTVWRYGALVTGNAFLGAPLSLVLGSRPFVRPLGRAPQFPVEITRVETSAVVIFYNGRVVKAQYADPSRAPILPIVTPVGPPTARISRAD
jgi:hypothetical protein